MATKWAIRHGLMEQWFNDLMNATKKLKTYPHQQMPLSTLTTLFAIKCPCHLLRHSCLTNHTIEWDKSKIITTNWHYHQHLCLEAWHINSAHTPLNCDGGLLPDNHFTPLQKKEQQISEHIKGLLVTVIRSPLINALNRSVETLGLWIVTSGLHSLNL